MNDDEAYHNFTYKLVAMGILAILIHEREIPAQQIQFIFIQLAMGLNNYHRAKKAFGSLKPENILVFKCFKAPHGPLVYKLDKVMAGRGDGTIADDLRDLGMIYHWLHMIGRQDS